MRITNVFFYYFMADFMAKWTKTELTRVGLQFMECFCSFQVNSYTESPKANCKSSLLKPHKNRKSENNTNIFLIISRYRGIEHIEKHEKRKDTFKAAL